MSFSNSLIYSFLSSISSLWNYILLLNSLFFVFNFSVLSFDFYFNSSSAYLYFVDSYSLFCILQIKLIPFSAYQYRSFIFSILLLFTYWDHWFILKIFPSLYSDYLPNQFVFPIHELLTHNYATHLITVRSLSWILVSLIWMLLNLFQILLLPPKDELFRVRNFEEPFQTFLANPSFFQVGY